MGKKMQDEMEAAIGLRVWDSGASEVGAEGQGTECFCSFLTSQA